MKNLFLFATMMLLAPALLKAQSADPELDYIKQAYSKEKKTIVDEYMSLNVQQGAKFWPVYGAYEAKREGLAQARVALVDEYVGYSAGITDAQADKTANAVLNNSISLSNLNLAYYKKMKKAVGAVNAAKFMQLETYLQTAWREYIQENIPVIGELQKTQKK